MVPASSGRRRFMSLGTHISASIAGVVVVACLLAYVGLAGVQREEGMRAREESARATTSLFTQLVATSLVFDDPKGLDESLGYLKRTADVLYVQVVDLRSGTPRVAAEFRSTHFGAPQILHTRSGGKVFADRLELVEPVLDAGGAVVGMGMIAFSLERQQATLARLEARFLTSVAALALFLIGLLVSITRRRVVGPLRRLTEAAARLEDGEYVELPRFEHDEVGVLTSAFDHLARVIREREDALAKRNADMKMVLDNVSQGFLIVGPDGRIAGEHSAIVERWFGCPEPGTELAAFLAGSNERLRLFFELSWAQLTEGVLPIEASLEQLPKRLRRERQTWSIEYELVAREGGHDLGIEKVVVVLTDITAELAREAAERGQRETVEIFRRLTADRAGFLDFLEDGSKLVAALAGRREDLAAQRRWVHTLKGNSAVLGMTSVAEACHTLETRLEEEQAPITADVLTPLCAAWEELEARARSFVRAEADVVEVRGADLRALEEMLSDGAPHAALLEAVERCRWEPVSVPVERLGEKARAIADRLGKGDLTVLLDTDDTRLPPRAHRAFWAAMVHVVRNAVDHGVEAPAERRARGKPARPKVCISARRDRGELVVAVEDDGRGIDYPALSERARAHGLPAESEADLVEALFSDGVSTRRVVSEISGRGVGLAAVRREVDRAGGSFTVRSRAGEGSSFEFRLPLGVGRERRSRAPDSFLFPARDAS